MTSEAIALARAMGREFEEARRRYFVGLREALPVGTPIRFIAHNGRKYNGFIHGPPLESGFVYIENEKTGRIYEIRTTFIEGL